jgi:hypothetical protein
LCQRAAVARPALTLKISQPEAGLISFSFVSEEKPFAVPIYSDFQ